MKIRATLTLLLAIAPAAHADIVTWRATGHVIDQLAYELGNGGVGHPGIFQVNLSFDSAASDRDPSSQRGSYGNLISVDIWVNGQPFSGFYGMAGSFIADADSALIIENDAFAADVYTDSLSIVANDVSRWGNELPWGDVPLNYFSLTLAHLDTAPGGALNSDAVPGTLPNLLDFELRQFILSGVYSQNQTYWFQVELDSLTAVPIPAAAWILVSGLGLLGIARHPWSGRQTSRS